MAVMIGAELSEKGVKIKYTLLTDHKQINSLT